jgi:hypothetical protein
MKIIFKKFGSKKKVKITDFELFQNMFFEYFPISLNKDEYESKTRKDQHLKTFIPYNNIITNVRAVSLVKELLKNLLLNIKIQDEESRIRSEQEESLIFEKTLSNEIKSRHKKIQDFLFYNNLIIDDCYYKYGSKKITSLKSVKFEVNLWNISNYMCFGVEPIREEINNKSIFLKIQKDEFISLGGESPDVLKTSIISYRDTFKMINFQNEYIPMSILTQFYLSFKPLSNLMLYIKLKNEIDETYYEFEHEISKIDLIAECILLSTDYKELMKINKNTSQFDFQLLKNQFSYTLKIIDIDNILNGNSLI